MWQFFLTVSSTLLGLALLGFTFRPKTVGLDSKPIFWVVLLCAGTAGWVVFFVCTVIDSAWWSIPSVVFLVLLGRSAMGASRNSVVKRNAAWQAELDRLHAGPAGQYAGSMAQSVLPAASSELVMDYGDFFVHRKFAGLVHARPGANDVCFVISLDLQETALSELIDAADDHVCALDTVTLKSVA